MMFKRIKSEEIVQLFKKSNYGRGIIKGCSYCIEINDYKGISYLLDKKTFLNKVFDDIQDKSFEGISLKITIEEVSNPFGNSCLLNKTLYSKDDSKILQVLPKEIVQEYEASLKRKFIDFKMLKKSA